MVYNLKADIFPFFFSCKLMSSRLKQQESYEKCMIINSQFYFVTNVIFDIKKLQKMHCYIMEHVVLIFCTYKSISI